MNIEIKDNYNIFDTVRILFSYKLFILLFTTFFSFIAVFYINSNLKENLHVKIIPQTNLYMSQYNIYNKLSYWKKNSGDFSPFILDKATLFKEYENQINLKSILSNVIKEYSKSYINLKGNYFEKANHLMSLRNQFSYKDMIITIEDTKKDQNQLLKILEITLDRIEDKIKRSYQLKLNQWIINKRFNITNNKKEILLQIKIDLKSLLIQRNGELENLKYNYNQARQQNIKERVYLKENQTFNFFEKEAVKKINFDIDLYLLGYDILSYKIKEAEYKIKIMNQIISVIHETQLTNKVSLLIQNDFISNNIHVSDDPIILNSWKNLLKLDMFKQDKIVLNALNSKSLFNKDSKTRAILYNLEDTYKSYSNLNHTSYKVFSFIVIFMLSISFSLLHLYYNQYIKK